MKNDYREVVVKWTGSGSDTLTLASLIATGQTVTTNPAAAIVAASVSTAGACTLTRNAQVALSTIGQFNYFYDDIHGMIDENSTADIAVNLASEGTVIIRVRKTQGYTEPTI